MVRSSRKVISAGSAPRAAAPPAGRFLDRFIEPEIWPEPVVIACRITGAEIT
jgi:hypothetical protein